MNPLFSYNNRLMAATALLSVALIAYQIAMMQLLSLVQWYHYANMVISVALLGFGTAGTMLSLMRRTLLLYSEKLLPVWMVASGLTMVAAVWLSRSDFARFDAYLLFVDHRQWFALLINYVLFFFPFFFGALALGIIFVKYVQEIGRFYFSNLLGSGLGAVLAAGLSWYFVPSVFPVFIALIAIASGLILVKRKNRQLVIALALTSTVFTFYKMAYPVDLTLSEYKSLSRTMQLPRAKILLEKPSPYGFVQVVSADGLRYAPGLSLAFTSEIPVKKVVFNNGDWFGPVVSWNRKDTVHLLDYTTMALPYFLEKRDKVLVLNAGTGLNISHALSKGALRIDAVEPHRAVANLLQHELANDTDSLFYYPQVKMHITEARAFLSAAHTRYNLIELPMVGAFGGTSGLYAMQEEYSLTREAFLQMWDLLDENGVISITAWMDYPFRNPLKITATLAETTDALGLSPAQRNLHLIAVRSWGTITFLLKKTPFTASELIKLHQFCGRYFFDPALLPVLPEQDRTFYNGMDNTSFFAYMDELLSGKREKLYKTYDFHLRPATDDKPYFSQFLRWKSLPHLAGVLGSRQVSFLELGYLVVAITFIQLSLMAVFLIILPLFKIGWRGGAKRWTFLYFSSLGIGYMFLEIVLIQKFILFFGNPVYAAALIIGVMLISSGGGSYLSSGWRLNRPAMQRILLSIVLLLLLYGAFLPELLQNLMGLSVPVKLGISLVMVALPAFLMGMPFPLGLRALARIQETNVPWAWGINGCMSVISAALATLLAVEAGFTGIMLLAAIAYAICLLSVYLYPEQ